MVINLNYLISTPAINNIMQKMLTWEPLTETISQSLEICGVYFIKETQENTEANTIENTLKEQLIYIGNGGMQQIKQRLEKHYNNSCGKSNNHISRRWFCFLTNDCKSMKGWNAASEEWKKFPIPRPDKRRNHVRELKNGKPLKLLQYAHIKTEDEFSSLILETYLLAYCKLELKRTPLCNKECKGDDMLKKHFKPNNR